MPAWRPLSRNSKRPVNEQQTTHLSKDPLQRFRGHFRHVCHHAWPFTIPPLPAFHIFPPQLRFNNTGRKFAPVFHFTGIYTLRLHVLVFSSQSVASQVCFAFTPPSLTVLSAYILIFVQSLCSPIFVFCSRCGFEYLRVLVFFNVHVCFIYKNSQNKFCYSK